MKNQKQLIHKKDWDVLLILDACRFDFFKEVYIDYLSGKLRKVKSPASDTPTWLLEAFPDYYGLRYVSGNPFINSYGLSLKDRIGEGLVRNKIIGDWYGGNTFKEVVDAWDWAWNRELGLVDPYKVTQNYEYSGGREVIHFVQPHAPYVGFPLHNREKANDGVGDESSNLWDLLGGNRFTKWLGKNVIDKYLSKVIKWERILKLQEFVGRDLEPLPRTIKVVGADKLLDIYKANLVFVLRAVNYLVNNELSNKKVVVSADHGELLGIKRPDRWGHPPYKNDEELRNVPWLEVNM